jgi:hypothetical protein
MAGEGRTRPLPGPPESVGTERIWKDEKKALTEVIRRILAGGWDGKMEILVLGPISEN